MWVVNKIGKEQAWYEGELIEQIRKIVQEQTNTRMLFADLKSYKAFCDIERLIQEFEQ
jgi:gamma-glutamyltranspeptidase